MDRAEYIHKRKARYMAQVLEAFEQQIEPYLPDDAKPDMRDFKGLVRARINALATDAVDLISLDGQQQNGVALELRDQLHPTGQT
jgi:hypothetical protein